MNIFNITLVALGSSLGGMLRFLVMQFLKTPLATLSVNIVGSFLAGLIFILLDKYTTSSTKVYLTSLILIGFLGGFTTFSAFSLETIKLLQNNLIYNALLNIISNLLFSLFACFIGVKLGNYFLKI